MNTILIDGHAHLYPGCDISASLDGAKEAFLRARRSIPGRDEGRDCLILVDHPRAEGFDALSGSEVRGWRFSRRDALTLEARREVDSASLLIFSGRQVRADNGLEVLGLLMRERVPEGGSLRECTERVLAEGAIAAIPWGFGKWLGVRGAEVVSLLESPLGSRIALADSSTRPPGPIWGGRRQFRRAIRRGVPILAGSDPLPLPGEESRLGSFGFALQDQIDAERPAQSMRRMLGDLSTSPRAFGRRETLIRGLRLQLALQLRR